MGRQEQHAEAGPLPLDLLEQRDPVHVLHAQVADHEIGPEPRERGERLRRALDRFDVVALRPQANAQQAQQARVVVDEQNSAAGEVLNRFFTLELNHCCALVSIVPC